MSVTKIITYNVNGIRAATEKGFMHWVKEINPDMICLQEIKALEEQIDIQGFQELGYESYIFSAKKKGYSGVAIMSKIKPTQVVYGCQIPSSDEEGRVITAHFHNFTLMSVYAPSGTTGDIRQDFKMVWLDDFFRYISDFKKKHPHLIICGDFNICHKEIDIHNPVSNKNSSGFLPEEREWVTKFLATGFLDALRVVNTSPHQYTWWSFRANSREKNLGWRIDYHFVTENMKEQIKTVSILPHVKHSDHCPVLLEIIS